MTSSSQLNYILYVYPGEKNSDRAINMVTWGPSTLSADGAILYEDIRIMKRAFKSIPPWLTVVPTLVNIQTRMMYRGSSCIKELEQCRENYIGAMSPSVIDAKMHTKMARGSAPEQQQVKIVEDLKTILPKDPRDELLYESNTSSAAANVSEETFSQVDDSSRDVILNNNHRKKAAPKNARNLMIVEMDDVPTPAQNLSCEDDSSAEVGA